MERMCFVPESLLVRLMSDSAELDCLQADGVDNWGGYMMGAADYFDAFDLDYYNNTFEDIGKIEAAQYSNPISFLIREVYKLKRREIDYIKLTCISPDMISRALGEEFEDLSDVNGWQVDYWYNTENFTVSGSMYYGTATITLREGK